MNTIQHNAILDRAASLLDLRPEEMCFDALWLEDAREAALGGDVPRLQALHFGWGSAVTFAEIEDGIGRIQIFGPLFQGAWSDYTDIREAFDTLMDDAGARAVVLDIDSPGGQVHGALADLAEAIRDRRGEKPVVAIANETATSAAYWIASSAGEVVASSRSAVLGSIGVIATHFDFSEMLKKDGVAVTEVVSGKLKNALSRYKPLSREGRELLSELVESAFVDFIDAVSAGRGLGEAAIRDLEGGILVGEAAVAADLADRVQSLDDVRAGLIEDAAVGAESVAAQEGDPEMAQKTTKTDAKTSETEPVVETKPVEKKATPEAKTAEVVDLDAARKEAREAGQKDAADATSKRTEGIRQACDLGACPDRFGEFLDSDLTSEQVGQKILADRAANGGPEISGLHHSGAAEEPVIDAAAIYRRWNG